jgi:imidazole glycerol-phosphate synthase subunit HisH
MNVAIVKYNAGNTGSVANALRRLGVEPLITDQPDELAAADKVIFPGVGEASSAMRHLREKGLDKLIPSLTQPVLAICLGMQLLCKRSDENDTACLGILPSTVRPFQNDGLKVPQIGWNNISKLRSPLFTGISDDSWVYFVHGYYVKICDETIAASEYGTAFSAAIATRNFFGVQFHPEKSGDVGERIIKNFLNM